MKKTITILLAVLAVFILNSSFLIHNCICQWQPDVRLTNDPASSNPCYNNGWCIGLSGNVVHVVWTDLRDGNYEIYYKRSSDEGTSWGADTRLTNNSGLSLDPKVAVSGEVVHIVWMDTRDGNYEIYYKRSTDGGLTWGADTRLTNNTAYSYRVSISLSASVVHIVWYDNRDGNYEIYYKNSTDGGTTWGTDTRLTNAIFESYYPSISASGSVVHVSWHDMRDGNREIYYKRSTDGGTSWGSDVRLTNDTAYSYYSSIGVSGSVVHIVWSDFRDSDYEIYYKRSTDGGSSWGSDTRLTNALGESGYPSISVSGSFVHIVWHDLRDGNWEIYYKRSTDGGISWSPDIRLTNEPAYQWGPSVTAYGSAVHVVWRDFRDGNDEIYYKRNPTGNITGIENITSEIPKEFKLMQNYPNPFNPTTNVQFSIINVQFVILKVFDILGREVATLVKEQLKPGTYEVSFDGSMLNSGVYFYRLLTPDFSETKRMLMIK
ncbi:MAG TPA: exo-alpha-sialidase [Ignavibacteria bacterium]